MVDVLNVREVEQGETLCYEGGRVRGFMYVGDRVSASGGCEAAVTVRTRCDWLCSRNVVITIS